MALTSYETITQALLQAPSSPIPLIPSATLDSYINEARQQVAGQGQCVRAYADLTLVIGQRQYNFSAITGLGTGVAGAFNVRQLWRQNAGGYKWLPPRPFEFFSLFALNNPVPANGQPAMWSQFGQGVGGNLYVDPPPDFAYACKVDVLGTPIPLVDDTTAEAIPAIWTLAIPFYAAWLGFQSLQRSADADKMMERFTQQMLFARNAANPSLMREDWQQSPDPMQANRLAVTQKAG